MWLGLAVGLVGTGQDPSQIAGLVLDSVRISAGDLDPGLKSSRVLQLVRV
jgi:hypothetical protein